jgi:carbonyl reductase 1
LGKQAVENLNKEGLKPNFHQLEIDNNESVVAFANYLKEKYGGLDILVNNAAILLRVLLLNFLFLH